MIEWLYYLLLLCVLVAGLLLTVFSLPGNWLMFLAVVGYGWATGWAYVGLYTIIALFVLAAVAEVVEFFAAGAGVKKAGGSLLGTIGALAGAVVGGIFLTTLIPIPVLGTFAGILAGTFLGATGAEMLGGKDIPQSALIGTGAAKGRFWGTVWKLAFGIAIGLAGTGAAIPVQW